MATTITLEGAARTEFGKGAARRQCKPRRRQQNARRFTHHRGFAFLYPACM